MWKCRRKKEKQSHVHSLFFQHQVDLDSEFLTFNDQEGGFFFCPKHQISREDLTVNEPDTETRNNSSVDTD